jgi:hypothetical protein
MTTTPLAGSGRVLRVRDGFFPAALSGVESAADPYPSVWRIEHGEG